MTSIRSARKARTRASCSDEGPAAANGPNGIKILFAACGSSSLSGRTGLAWGRELSSSTTAPAKSAIRAFAVPTVSMSTMQPAYDDRPYLEKGFTTDTGAPASTTRTRPPPSAGRIAVRGNRQFPSVANPGASPKASPSMAYARRRLKILGTARVRGDRQARRASRAYIRRPVILAWSPLRLPAYRTKGSMMNMLTAGPQRTGPRLGLGIMGMSEVYGPADDRESPATLRASLDGGVRLVETGDAYGMGHGELLLGEALRARSRESVVISIRFGALREPGGGWTGSDSRPVAVKNALAFSLRRMRH